jgi:hypothetical protein
VRQILAVLLAILGFAVPLGFFNCILTNYIATLGIGILIVALYLFVYGWYSYKSGKPQGTIRVEN